MQNVLMLYYLRMISAEAVEMRRRRTRPLVGVKRDTETSTLYAVQVCPLKAPFRGQPLLPTKLISIQGYLNLITVELLQFELQIHVQSIYQVNFSKKIAFQ